MINGNRTSGLSSMKLGNTFAKSNFSLPPAAQRKTPRSSPQCSRTACSQSPSSSPEAAKPKHRPQRRCQRRTSAVAARQIRLPSLQLPQPPQAIHLALNVLFQKIAQT